MSVAAEKVAELLALPSKDRAYIAHELLRSLDDTVDEGAEAEWMEVIDRRMREMKEGVVDRRSEEEMLRGRLDAARRKTS